MSTPETPESPPSGMDRLRRSFFSPSRGQAVVAVLVAVLAFAAVTQARLTGEDDTYAGLRQAELIQALNGLQAASRKAERDIDELEATRDRLSSNTQRRTTALEQARKEVRTLGVLAGTVPATGPGIRITVEDPQGDLSLNHLLDGIEELRNAGVEAIEINDQVRVIAQTSFDDDPDGIRVDGVLLKPPYVIDAIGNPDTLAGALEFQDGFTDDVEDDNGTVSVKKGRSDQGHRHPNSDPAPLRRTRPRAVACRGGACRTSASVPATTRSSVIPEDLKYTSEHEWLREPGQAEGSVRVGITDYAQDALGDIVFVQLPEVGETVTAGAVVGELESTKSVSEVYAPLGGEIVTRNEALDATPELVNTDPYGDGWLFEIVADNSGSADLLDAATYQTTLEA